MNALNVLCAQLTRNLFAIAKFLFGFVFADLTTICKQVRVFIFCDVARS